MTEVLISPKGERVEVDDLYRFAKEKGLDFPNLLKVVQGWRQHHKGWRSEREPHGFTNKPWGIERYVA